VTLINAIILIIIPYLAAVHLDSNMLIPLGVIKRIIEIDKFINEVLVLVYLITFVVLKYRFVAFGYIDHFRVFPFCSLTDRILDISKLPIFTRFISLEHQVNRVLLSKLLFLFLCIIVP